MCSEKPRYSKDICLPCCNITDYCRLSHESSLSNQPGSLWNRCISLLSINDSAVRRNVSLLTLSVSAHCERQHHPHAETSGAEPLRFLTFLFSVMHINPFCCIDSSLLLFPPDLHFFAFLKGIPMPHADSTPQPCSKWLTLLPHPLADGKCNIVPAECQREV